MPRPAAAYMRMSTEHQRYSLEHQTRAIEAYADERGYELVRTYADKGKSGLHIEGRVALSELLRDVVGGERPFEVILVLDVSRWGRFQDPDEGAHYEFICRSSGVPIEYCAEAFDNDGGLISSMVKQLKRTMAAEYSRELSFKVSATQRGLAAQGFRMAGAPGYGLRRLMIDERGMPAGILEAGQRKAVQGRRITLVPGPADEVATVRRIYRLYVRTGLTMRAIARLLNDEGVAFTQGRRWTERTVAGVLTNRKYVGDNVFGRTAKRLQRRSQPLPPEQWIFCPGAFEPLVDRASFRRSQARRAGQKVAMSREQMLRALTRLWRREGFLSARLINDAKGVPCVSIYSREFGGLKGAYEQVGYDRFTALRSRGARMSDAASLSALARLRARRGQLSAHIINGARGLPGADGFRARFGSLEAAYALIGYDATGSGSSRVRKDPSFTRDGMIAGLRQLLAERGRLTVAMVDADLRLPSRATFYRRFGSMGAAFELAGYRVRGLYGVAARAHLASRRRARRAAAAIAAAQGPVLG